MQFETLMKVISRVCTVVHLSDLVRSIFSLKASHTLSLMAAMQYGPEKGHKPKGEVFQQRQKQNKMETEQNKTEKFIKCLNNIVLDWSGIGTRYYHDWV